MQITIASSEIGPGDRPHVSFTARFGTGGGVWRGVAPNVGDVFQVEMDLLDPIEVGKNAEICSAEGFMLALDRDIVLMTILVEQVDPDNVAYFRLGSDCLFLVDIAGAEVESGQWLSVRIPVAHLELFPYDSARLTVVERGPGTS